MVDPFAKSELTAHLAVDGKVVDETPRRKSDRRILGVNGCDRIKKVLAERIVRNVSAGVSLDVIEATYRAHCEQFVRVAAGITGNVGAGADAVQDAFVSCIRDRAHYRGQGDVRAWVWRAVVTSALKVRRNHPVWPLDDGEGGELSNESGLDVEEVRAAVRALPERARVILFLTYYADLDYRTIAEVLKISQGTVGATLHSARIALRRRLEEVIQL